ncbi:hypothetical protein GCM10009555_069300 [Acrocarpospora macrocephala]|uniref:Uncharacterized protein n=1 Tax=Acrocarpospora macrocephala TaxID=150177 RepID=A0A5M3X7F4_9ACTN|nr:hypothetical protein [Acrocarpospora macrocephala]GES16109.1 hypothetical protein Amac_097070 [Acrocarpospora macrocephala]
MQSYGDGDDLSLTFYCKDPDSNQDNECETFYRTDRGSWLVQVKKRGPRVGAQLIGLGEDETFGELSERTMNVFVRKYVREHYGVDLPAGTG